MDKTFNEVILYFFIYSVIGWIWETAYCSIKAKKFVYRGFLYGPYCPIYGFGILMVLYIIRPIQGNIFQLFLYSATIVTILEYFTSYLLEKLFHASWWNYDEMPLNLHGRIAIPVSIFWGVCCIVITKYIHPAVDGMVQFLHAHMGVWLPVTIAVLMIADAVKSVTNLMSFQNMLEKAEQHLDQIKVSADLKKEELQARRQEWIENAKARIAEKLPPLKAFDIRMLRAYPALDMRTVKNFKTIRNALVDKILKK